MTRVRIALVVALAIACGPAQSPPRPDVGFYDRLFQRPANVTMVVRIADTIRDPFYGPYLRHAYEKHGAKPDSLASVFAHSEELDVAVAVTSGARSKDIDGIAVLYGADADPLTIREDDDPIFESPNRLASGATEYRLTHDHEFALFTVHGAWVFAHGAAIERSRASFGESTTPPPRLGLEPSALLAADVHASALDGRDTDRTQLEGTARIVADSLDEAEMILTPSGTGDFVSRFWLKNEDAAKILEGEILASMKPDARCDSTCKLVRAVISSAFDVQRDGKYVAVRLHVPEKVLRKILE